MRIIPKWLRISAVIVMASAAFIFALGGFITNVVNATTAIPSIQKDLNDTKFQHKEDIARLQINTQQDINSAYQKFNETITQFTDENQKDHSTIKQDVVEIRANIRQIDKKTDQILTAILQSKPNAIRDRVLK